MENKIEGVPEGWELVAIRKAKKGEFSVVGENTNPKEWEFNTCGVYPIVRKLPEPLKIEAGKYYKQRDGQVVGPMVKLAHGGGWPWTLDGKRRGDQWNDSGKRCLEGFEHTDLVEEVPAPEPAYRPFANAEEFKPHRGKWISRKGEGAFKVAGYSERNVHIEGEGLVSYEELLSFMFEDGTPCGVKLCS